MPKVFSVYILTNRRQTLYIGVTSDLPRRLQQHLAGAGSAFVRKYHLTRLIYVETAARAIDAIAREKELKGWTRARKMALIATMNPEWKDLAEEEGWGTYKSGPSRA